MIQFIRTSWSPSPSSCFSVLARVRLFPLIPILQSTRSCASSPHNLTRLMSSSTHCIQVFLLLPLHLRPSTARSLHFGHPITCMICILTLQVYNYTNNIYLYLDTCIFTLQVYIQINWKNIELILWCRTRRWNPGVKIA